MSLNIEFEKLRNECLAIVGKAKAESRAMNTTEKAEYDSRFNRMQELRAPNADVELDDFKAAITASRVSNRAATDFSAPLAKGESLFNRMGFKPSAFGLGDFLRASVIGPRNEAERFALQSGSDNNGGFDVPANIAAQFIDHLRGESAYLSTGATVLPMTDRWRASQVVDPTAAFRAEDGAVNTATPFTGVSLSPKSLSVIIKVSREQLEDSVNVNAEIERTLSQAMALAADAAIGFGASNGPTALVSTSGILSVTSAANGDQITDYSKLLSAVYELESNNTKPSAAIMHPREAKAFNALKDTTNQPLRRPHSLEALPFYSTSSTPINQTQGTSNVASTIIVGDFSRLLVGMRVGLRIETLKELYAASYEYGFRASIRFDSLATRAKSFCKVTGLIP